MLYLRSTIIALLLTVFLNLNAQDIKVSVGEVKDSRTTGEYFAELEINLKLFGDILEKAKSIRCVIDKAVDDTGRDLIKEDQGEPEFEDMDQDQPDRKDINIRLKNPSRKAASVEISGTVDVFIPKNDPGALITIKDFSGAKGNLKSNALKSAGIDLIILTAEQFKTIQDEQKEKLDTSNVMGQMVQALSSLFGGMMEPGEHSIILQMHDPDTKVIKFEFTDKKGEVFNPMSTSTMDDVKIFDFENQLPNDVQLKLYLRTEKSMKSVAFSVKDILLP